MSETPDALAPREEEADVRFEPVIKLTEKVDTKTLEEDEIVVFKRRAKLFRFDTNSSEWKERGTGDVKLLEHKETKRNRVLMRRDGTLKVCANHSISKDMKLTLNIGSSRSWVYKVNADYAEDPPTPETLAIRFSDSENAEQFKAAFEEAQRKNIALTASSNANAEEEKKEEPEQASERDEEKEEAKQGGEEEEKEKEPEAQKD